MKNPVVVGIAAAAGVVLLAVVVVLLVNLPHPTPSNTQPLPDVEKLKDQFAALGAAQKKAFADMLQALKDRPPPSGGADMVNKALKDYGDAWDGRFKALDDKFNDSIKQLADAVAKGDQAKAAALNEQIQQLLKQLAELQKDFADYKAKVDAKPATLSPPPAFDPPAAAGDGGDDQTLAQLKGALTAAMAGVCIVQPELCPATAALGALLGIGGDNQTKIDAVKALTPLLGGGGVDPDAWDRLAKDFQKNNYDPSALTPLFDFYQKLPNGVQDKLKEKMVGLADDALKSREKAFDSVTTAMRDEKKANADLNAVKAALPPSKKFESAQQKADVELLCTVPVGRLDRRGGGRRRAGLEYLTEETQDLLKWAMAADTEVARCMRQPVELCQFGPDGRAAADWMTTAVGVALDEAEREGWDQAVLEDRRLIDTVVESVAHKIYDTFSQGSRPDLTARKERAVLTICRQIFTRREFDAMVHRTVDDAAALAPPFTGFGLPGASLAQLHAAFIDAKVTGEKDVGAWLEAVRRYRVRNDLVNRLEANGLVRRGGGLAGFTEGRHDRLARLLAGLLDEGDDDPLRALLAPLEGPLRDELREKFEGPRREIGGVRRPIFEQVKDYVGVRAVGLDAFRRVCDRHRLTDDDAAVMLLVRDFEDLWSRNVEEAAPAVAGYMIGLSQRDDQGRPVAHPVAALLELLPLVREVAGAFRDADAGRYFDFLHRVEAELRK
jgi:hypothetical protein